MPRSGSKAKVLFIMPYHEGTSKFMQSSMGALGRRLSTQYPLGLGLLAALTPRDEFSTTLVNEYWGERPDYQAEVDIVAISSMTCTAPRAYEIADRFRSLGCLVVLGGNHATACAEEARLHADVVFVGEAEETWPRFLKDFRAGRVKPLYRPSRFVPPELIPLPDRFITKRNRRLSKVSIVASRGCPYGCDFCSVTSFFGRKVRCRPVDQVMEEIKQARSLEKDPVGMLAFKNDNIGINKRYTHELLEKLIPLNMQWLGQSDLRTLDDPELVKIMGKSGCSVLAVGLESVHPCHVKRLRKTYVEKKKIKEVISLLHKNNIYVWGSYVIGFDEDTPESIERIYEEALYLGIDFFTMAVLTPFPGTALYEKMRGDNRIINKQWEYYDFEHLVFEPKNISPRTLEKLHFDTMGRFYDASLIGRRIGKSFLRIFQSGRYVPLRYVLVFNLVGKIMVPKTH